MPETPLPDDALPEEVPEERRGRHRMWAWFIAGLVAIALIVLMLRPWRSAPAVVPPDGADTTVVQ